MQIKNLYHSPGAYLQHLFGTGLIFLIPIIITYAFFSFFFNMIKSLLLPIKNLHIPLVENIPHHEIFILIIFIFIIGILVKAFIFKPIIHMFEDFFARIPLIKTIYLATKQLTHAFTAHDQASFKKVVIIEFPRQGMYSIGFLTKEIPTQISSKQLFGIYVPHTPNPATGSFVMLPADAFTETDLTRQEATALVISGGILQPTRFHKINS